MKTWLCCFTFFSFLTSFELQAPYHLIYRATPLFKGTTAYFAHGQIYETTGQFRSIRIISMAGCRVEWASSSTTLAYSTGKFIFKTNSSLRTTLFPHRDMILTAMIIKIILRQSWAITTWANASGSLIIPGPQAFISTAGFGVYVHNSVVLGLHPFVDIVSANLKTATISNAELVNMKTEFLSQNTILNSDPKTVCASVFNKFIQAPDNLNIFPSSNFPEIRGFPYHGISQMYVNSFTLQEAQESLLELSRAPLSILIISSTALSDHDLVDIGEFSWDSQRPRTDMGSDGNNVGFTTLGEEIIIPCQGGNPGDFAPLLVVNLGPLSKESIIAADLMSIHFKTYAIPNEGDLLYSAINYETSWAPCGGCAVVMVRFKDDTPYFLLDETHQLGIIRSAIQNFRMNFSLTDISNNLLNDWSDSLGTNQASRNLTTWVNAQQASVLAFASWWTEIFGTTNAFYTLKTFGATILAGGAVGTLYQDVYDLIQDQLLLNTRNFDIWIFQKD